MWETITPETVSQYVRFKRKVRRDDEDWDYDPNEVDMFAKQAEGTAFLWNRLSEHGVALLADEVGMGKTIQALAVLSLLFHQKPDARVLIIAPRRVVAENWMSEYHTFIAQHYRKDHHKSNVFAAEIGGKPVHPPIHCENLYDLAQQYSRMWPHVMIARTSSFSGLLKENLEYDSSGQQRSLADKQTQAFSEAKSIRNELYELKERLELNQPAPFDLLIVDEAHYYRTKHQGSQKVAAAQAFFGAPHLDHDQDSPEEWKPIAQKTLLLTATPNHSNEQDIERILSYFPHAMRLPEEERSEEILKRIGLRRFRRFESKTKYQYRKEEPLTATFRTDSKDGIASEAFFAVYQKHLAQTTEHPRKVYLHGYLEGFEAIPASEADTDDEEVQNNKDGDEESQVRPGDVTEGGDFQRSEADSALLNDLVRVYREHHGRKDAAPRHPKYDKLVESITGNNSGSDSQLSKAVVFVRRIPSTKEISRRLNRADDTRLARKLALAYGATVSKSDHNRTAEDWLERAHNLARESHLGRVGDEPDPSLEEETQGSERELEYRRSIVLDLFRVESNKRAADDPRPRQYGALFEQIQSFRKKCINRQSILSVLFHPGADYWGEPYTISQLTRARKSDGRDYEGSAFCTRASNLEGSDKALVPALRAAWGIDDCGTAPASDDSRADFNTLWTLFWQGLKREDRRKVFHAHF